MATAELLDLQKKLAVALALDAEGQARRAAAAQRKAAAHAEYDRNEPGARKAWEKAAREHAAVKAEFNRTQQITTQTWWVFVGVSQRREREVNLADAELRDTAPSQYNAFLEVLVRWVQECRRGRGPMATARMRALEAARKQVEELKLDPSQDDKADQHIAKIKADLPPLEA